MKVKTNIKVGAIMIEGMTVHHTVRDNVSLSGSVVSAVKEALNHNQTVARGLKIQSSVKAGIIAIL